MTRSYHRAERGGVNLALGPVSAHSGLFELWLGAGGWVRGGGDPPV